MNQHALHLSSSNFVIGSGYKKVFCNLCGSYISLDECAYSTISHDPRLPSTPVINPCVSCNTYGESTKIPTKNGDLVQKKFHNPPFEDLDFILVGLGEKGVNCGVIFASHICQNLDCLKVHYSKQRCLRRACPNCYKKWKEEEKKNITARILSKEAIKKNNGKRLVEITLSPDQKEVPENRYEFERRMKEGYKYIKEKGAKGGCAIIHPFRATREAKKLSWKSNKKTWEWIRKQKNPESYFYYSPHLHVLAYINHLSEPKSGEAWIYKTKTNEEGRVIDFLRKAKREEALKKRINYFLSHTGTLKEEEGTFHSVRWFGTCSYNKFKTTEEERGVRETEEREELKCKICGKELMHFWVWVKRSYGDIFRDIENNVLDPPKYWEEVRSAVEKEDPPADAEKYLIKEE